MKDFSKLTTEELNKMEKHVLITIIVSLQQRLNAISTQLDFLTEQIALMNQRTFGRKTEQIEGQMVLPGCFNEPEALSDGSAEPEITEVIVSTYTRKKKSTREEKLEGLPARIFDHKLSEEKLAELFPNGYKELPPEVYKRLSVIPATFLVDEHHVHVYAAKNNDGTIVKADRPPDLFRNSIATPSLVGMVIAAKYANHMPLERQSKLFETNGVHLGTNTLANWMMKSTELYFSLVYDEMKKILIQDSKVIHADESHCQITNDGRPAGSKSFMWVYRNGKCDADHPIVIYDFQKTRHTDHPREFLGSYSGVLVTDGYQPYHTLDKQRDDLTVAGCWVHAKRKFSELVKAKGADSPDGTIAAEAVKKISRIFHLDNKLDDLCKTDRERQRRITVKPAVDAFFAWAKTEVSKVTAGSATYKGLQYCINQEQFLRVFLKNGDVPMDNNRAEQAIRPFTLGRKNWVMINTLRGAEASAILYSLVETARANNLRTYEYLTLLLEELIKHADDTNLDFIQNLMPWSEKVQSQCHSLKKT